MITDRLLTVSGSNTPGSAITGQAVTATAVSTDTIDLGTARDIGEGRDLFMVFTVVVGFAGTGTITMQIVTDDNASLSSPTVIAATGAITATSLTAGSQYIVPIPPQVASLGERYLGAQYTCSASPTTGTFLTQIVTDIQDGRKYYASGFSVSNAI